MSAEKNIETARQMVAVCVLVLVDQRAALSGIPFSWAHLTGGLAGLSAGFPLALFMFIGWENGPALAEESRNPRRTTLIVPFAELCQPGQPAPYNACPVVALALVAAAAVIACLVVHRHPLAGAGEGAAFPGT
jgi:amino acid transporter